MSNLHDLQVRAADLERTIADTGDEHGSLLNGLESGLRELRQRLTEAKAANDRLARENVELKSIVEQLLGRLETKPADSLHDKLAALDGQLYGLLEISGGQTSADGSPEIEAPVSATPVAAGEDRGAEGGGAEGREAEEGGAEGSGVAVGGPFEDIRERLRSLSDQLLSPIAVSADSSATVPAPVTTGETTPEPVDPAPGRGRASETAARLRAADQGVGREGAECAAQDTPALRRGDRLRARHPAPDQGQTPAVLRRGGARADQR